VDYVKNFPMTR